jgi:hypothetical protein
MIILAVDPGITGALAFYDTASQDLDVVDMPILDGDVNPHEIRAYLVTFLPDIAIIEHVHPHPNEGVSSVWRFAAAFTTARVVVQMQNIPTMLVSPAKWKRKMGLRGGALGKEQARRLVVETFPIYAHRFSRKKDHGRAEAALLAVYASGLPTLRNYSHEQQQHSASEADPVQHPAAVPGSSEGR